MAWEKVVTLFDSKAHADAAVANLVNAGFSDSDISVVGTAGLPTDLSTYDPRLWRRLFGRDFSDADTATFANTITDGGVVLTVRTHADSVARALEILDQHGLGIGRRKNQIHAEAELIPVTRVREDLGKDSVLKRLQENVDAGMHVSERTIERILEKAAGSGVATSGNSDDSMRDNIPYYNSVGQSDANDNHSSNARTLSNLIDSNLMSLPLDNCQTT